MRRIGSYYRLITTGSRLSCVTDTMLFAGLVMFPHFPVTKDLKRSFQQLTMSARVASCNWMFPIYQLVTLPLNYREAMYPQITHRAIMVHLPAHQPSQFL